MYKIKEKNEEIAQPSLMNEKAGSGWHTLRLSPYETGALPTNPSPAMLNKKNEWKWEPLDIKLT